MSNEIDYTPERVRAILAAWPEIEAAREKGTLVLSPVAYRNSFEEKVASQEARQMFPRPKRSSNRIYTIDDCAVVILDVDRAFNKVVNPINQKRLRLHYLHGYEYGEIASMEGNVTEEAVKRACIRATEKMAEWLESPKEPKPEATMPERELTYKRKYTSLPPNYTFN